MSKLSRESGYGNAESFLKSAENSAVSGQNSHERAKEMDGRVNDHTFKVEMPTNNHE
jgi:hypothetical protein